MAFGSMCLVQVCAGPLQILPMSEAFVNPVLVCQDAESEMFDRPWVLEQWVPARWARRHLEVWNQSLVIGGLAPVDQARLRHWLAAAIKLCGSVTTALERLPTDFASV